MAADRESTFVLKFDGDEGTLRSVLASLKSQIKSDVADLERVTSKVELFKDVAKNVTTAGAAVSAARAKVDELVASIASIKAASGQSVTGLEKEMKAAEKQLAATTRESDKQQASLAKLDAQLKAAGIDTSKLATEEARLAQALQAATTNATNRAAQQALGLRTLRDVTPELNRLRAAYNTLSVSGTLSVKELAIAQQQLQTRLAEVRASVTGAAGAAKAGGPDLVNFFKNSILPALGVTATIGTVVAGIKEAVAAAKEFQQGVAEIGTVTNLSKEQLAGLGAGARQLATDLGVDVQAALKGVFDLIRSGVSPDNALEVLRVSAEAAKAALTDVGTGVKVANLLLDSFGADVSDLPILFDKIIKGAHDGGATLKEFAEAGGPLLNVARAAGASFDELLAVLTVLVDKSGDVGKSFSDLTKILARLQTSDVRAKLRDLNIEGTSIVDIFRQIGERGLTLADVLGVDLAGGGARSAASLATLTTNAKLVPEELERIAKAGGEAARNIRDLFDTPKERADRFDAAVKESSIQLGTLVGASSRVGVAVTGLLTAFNKLPAEFKEANLVGLNFTAIAAAMAVNMKEVAAESQRARDGVAKYGSASGDASDQVSRLADSQKRVRDEIEATARAANAAKAELGDFATRLTADVQALQAASARDLSDINARADAQIAALDRGRLAQAATAAATLAIDLQAAADRLAIISKSEVDITAAVDKANQARSAIARTQGQNEAKIAADAATARIAALGPVLAQYQQHYATLIGLAQTYAARAQSAEQARVDIVRAVTEEIRQIRLSDLGALDEFVAKQKHIDELISEGRRKATRGDIEAAKQFFDQAIAESKGLTTVIDQNGVVVITQLQAREARLSSLKKVADAANESIGDQGKAAAKGANEALKAADAVETKIKSLQKTYDDLKKTAAAGLGLKVTLDEQSVANAISVLDQLTRPRTVTVTVNTVAGTTTPQGSTPQTSSGGGNGEHFARGGLVRPFARGGYVPRFPPAAAMPITPFASGGAVFRGPKVPGVGNTDSYLTRLQPGSFVVRKAASAHYGDAMMQRMARGYATGGVAANILSPGAFATKFLSGQNDLAVRFAIGAHSPDVEKYRDTLAKLQTLREKGQGLKPVRAGEVGLGDFAALLISRFDLLPTVKKDRIKEVIDSSFEGWLAGLQEARQLGVAAAIDFSLLALLAKGGSVAQPGVSSYPRGTQTPRASPWPAYAAGGPSTDTVPAMLTPGEFVVPRPTVKRLGTDFLYALNRMSVPKLDLAARLMPPLRPQYFESGGQVGDVAPRQGTTGATGGRSIAVSINAAAGDILSRENIRRLIIPVLEEEQRKSR